MTLRSRLAGLLTKGGSPSTYAPEIDGEPDPGEVVWAWVPYEEDPSQGTDRPVLVLDTDGDGWTSEVRLDRLLRLERDGVRREGAALDERVFAAVVEAVRGLPR